MRSAESEPYASSTSNWGQADSDSDTGSESPPPARQRNKLRRSKRRVGRSPRGRQESKKRTGASQTRPKRPRRHAVSSAASSSRSSESDEEADSASSPQRQIVPLDDLAHAPALDLKVFDGWAELDVYLRNYSKRTLQDCETYLSCVTV
ncbi:hypothetical protein PF003_g26110 [Phytophthora fragariae]|nr:hypothetical protein PF003_g26110 [Phytophthora fragariae]